MLIVTIGIVISSAFPAIVVFAQELMPGRVGMIAGIFFGFAFGAAGIAAAVAGWAGGYLRNPNRPAAHQLPAADRPADDPACPDMKRKTA